MHLNSHTRSTCRFGKVSNLSISI